MAVFEIGADRYVGGCSNCPAVVQLFFQRRLSVRFTQGKCKAAAGGGECFEAQALQQARGARIPRIGNDKSFRFSM